MQLDTMSHDDLRLTDRWILSRLAHTIADMTRLIDEYQLGEAGRAAYDFAWGDFADWYIEASKITLNGSDTASAQRTRLVLVHVLDQTLRLLHPYMPFVTEEIWQHLKKAIGDQKWPEALIIAPWPVRGVRDWDAEKDMDILMQAIRMIRNARAEYNVQPGMKLAAMIASNDKSELFEAHRAELSFLARIDDDGLHVTRTLDAIPHKALSLVDAAATIYLPLAQLVDLDAERGRLGKELEETRTQIERSEKLLASEFAGKAPEAVVQKERDKLVALQEKQGKLAEQLAALN
jgi:valyl-tRNA synthetase